VHKKLFDPSFSFFGLDVKALKLGNYIHLFFDFTLISLIPIYFLSKIYSLLVCKLNISSRLILFPKVDT